MPHTYQCIIITKARPIESFEGEKNEVVTQLFKMRQFIPIKWYWYNSFESSSHNMSTRINNHKMCTKGSFIFLNHVHSYMELPICGLATNIRNVSRPVPWPTCWLAVSANHILHWFAGGWYWFANGDANPNYSPSYHDCDCRPWMMCLHC